MGWFDLRCFGESAQILSQLDHPVEDRAISQLHELTYHVVSVSRFAQRTSDECCEIAITDTSFVVHVVPMIAVNGSHRHFFEFLHSERIFNVARDFFSVGTVA